MRQLFVFAVAIVSGCASANVIQTSQNTAIVKSSAAPACGGQGAARVAQKEAAIATLKAGYDRYIIMDAASANNVHVYQTPGTYSTTAVANGPFISATTTYNPGMPIVAGSFDQSFAIRMFHNGEPGAENALSAKAVLGPDWQKALKQPILTCTN